MKATRRDFIIGGLCAGGMGLAAAAVPRRVEAAQRGVDLNKAIPKQIGPWKQVEIVANVLPESEDSLSARLYSQLVNRVYTAPGRDTVMMVIAYGNTQSDTLQLHRPEVCYEAAGFRVETSEPVDLRPANNELITARYLYAEAAYRKEAILYWTRIGGELPRTRFEQQMSKLRAGIAGVVPDGALSRFSVMVETEQPMPSTLPEFADHLLNSVTLPVRRMLIGAAAR